MSTRARVIIKDIRCPKRVGIETTSENEAIRLWKLLKNMG